MDVDAWLRQLGLPEYIEAFRANHIAFELLPSLSASDLAELGVKSVGHRRMLLDAISRLGSPHEQTPAPAAQAPATMAGERRQVTVLFADISGFTRLSEQLDAEQTHRLLAAFFEQVDAIVVSLAGRIDKHIGDCVMAVFGAPVAHADDVRRAAVAAIKVHAAMQTVSQVAGLPVSAHVGIATGEVVASRTGSTSFVEYTVTGETVNLASRLTDVARPGETVVTGEVVSALGTAFEGEPLPERPIRGFARRIGLWTLHGLQAQGRGRQLPIIGRRAQLGQCLSLIGEMSETGAGANVIIVGEPGIGKTRLIEEIAAEAEGRGVRVARVALVDFGAGLDHDVVSELAVQLDTLAGEREAGHDLSVLQKDLLRAPLTPGERSMLSAMSEQQRVVSRCEAFVDVARRAALIYPLLIVVEDVHWAGQQIVTSLDQLGKAIAQSVRAVLVLTTRPLTAGRQLLDGVQSTTIDLGPLRGPEAAALARLHLAEDTPGIEDLVDRSGGNPLFLEQLIRHSLQGLAGGAIPGSIRSIILARIDQLREADKLALQTAAVLGDEPAAAALDALLAEGAQDLGNLSRQRFLQRSGGSFRFAHALIREVCYGAMLRPQRIALHRKAAAWFEARDPVLHAEHLGRGEDPAAAPAFLAAANHLVKALRLEQALDCIVRGLALADGNEQRYRLSLAHGELLLDLARPQEAIAAFQLAEQAAPDNQARAAATLGRAGALRLVDQLDAAFALLDECAPVLEAFQAHAMLSRLEHLRGNLYFPRGLMDACSTAHRKALAHAELAASAELTAQALGGLGDAAYACGAYLTAYRHFTACVESARQLGLGKVELANRPMQVISRALAGTAGGVIGEAEKAIALADAARQPRAELIARHAAMFAHLWAGRADLVHDHFSAAQAIVEKIGARRFEPENLAFMAEGMRQLGRTDEAARLLERALAMCRETGMTYIGPSVLALTALAFADDKERCAAALEEGEHLASSGLKHNAWFFGCYAIETAIQTRDGRGAERFAGFLERQFTREALPIVEVLVERARLLARIFDGVAATELLAEARHCRDRIHELDVGYFARALDQYVGS
jgi:class 3 adenylate cyclase/tetratricopeptide (TPR) repeat protein